VPSAAAGGVFRRIGSNMARRWRRLYRGRLTATELFRDSFPAALTSDKTLVRPSGHHRPTDEAASAPRLLNCTKEGFTAYSGCSASILQAAGEIPAVIKSEIEFVD
jgi:hypothetical protein